MDRYTDATDGCVMSGKWASKHGYVLVDIVDDKARIALHTPGGTQQCWWIGDQRGCIEDFKVQGFQRLPGNE